VFIGGEDVVTLNFGLTLASIRENHQAEMLGIDIRRYQLLVFVLGGVLSGLSEHFIPCGIIYYPVINGFIRRCNAGHLGCHRWAEKHFWHGDHYGHPGVAIPMVSCL
jgi:hypothetical protein